MKMHAFKTPFLLALTALGLSAATGLAFAMWLKKGPAIFMTLVESGLSWCF